MNAETFDEMLANCTGLDDARWRAASMIVDAWGPALAHAQRFGYELGYAAGYGDAEREMAEMWHTMWLDVRATLERPTHAELVARRREAA